jgi:YD repeat-containing protein
MSATVCPPNNPWKGLYYYTEEDSQLFFGRSLETEELLRLIQHETLTVLFARSGLGKTSLLRAGVIPKLREQDFLPVIVRIDYAESAQTPVQQIVSAIFKAADEARIDIEVVNEDQPLTLPNTWDASLWEFFQRHQFWSPRNDPIRVILILDQFEEAFTLGRQNPLSLEFIQQQLADLVENRMPRSFQSALEASGERLSFDSREQHFKVILSLRDDYVSKLDSLRPFMPSVMRNRYALSPLNKERALEIVQESGKKWITETVAREIVVAVSGEDGGEALNLGAPERLALGEIEPAYLSVMCDELFRHMLAQNKAEIDLKLVQVERGNILDALYERSFTKLKPATREFVEDRLLTTGGFRASIPVSEAEREGIARSELNSLVDSSRLLRFEDRLGTTHVELSHDLLTPIVLKSRDARWAAVKAEAEAEKEAKKLREIEYSAKLIRMRRGLRTVLATLVLLITGIGFYLYGWGLNYRSFSANFTKRWGAMYPVGQLSKSAVSHRSWTLELTQKGRFGKVQTVKVIDANHQLSSNAQINTYLTDSNQYIDPIKRPARVEFIYDKNERIVYEVAFDWLNRMVWGFVYAPNGTTGEDSSSTKAMYLGADGYGYTQPQDYNKTKTDDRNSEIKTRQNDRKDNALSKTDNTAGSVWNYTDKGSTQSQGGGQAIKSKTDNTTGFVWNYANKGSTQFQGSGQAIKSASSKAEFVEIYYDERGFETEIYFKDKEGNAMPGADHAYGVRQEYDENGRMVRKTSLNSAGNPMNDETGNAGMEAKYDDNGNVIEARSFNANNEPTLTKNGVYRTVSQYDQWGRLIGQRFLNLAEEPVIETIQTGAYRITYEYDVHGNTISIKLYNTANKPIIAGIKIWDFATHEQRASYDAKNRPETIAYFDGEGKPLTSPEGYHSYRLTYDDNSFVSAVSYFDAKDKPVLLKSTGFHQWEKLNNELGQVIEEKFYDMEHRPVATLDGGYHLRKNTYDKAGNLTAQSYFDVNGKPVVDQFDNAHRYEKRYDSFGNTLLTLYYGTDGQPSNNKQGFHKVESTYDDYGNLVNSRWYDEKNSPTEGPDGVHEVRNTYDPLGLKIGTAYFDTQNRPTTDRQGIHETHYAYNEQRLETKRQIFGLNHKPAEDSDDNHLIIHEYNERGQITRVTQLRADGSPNYDRELGIATVVAIYDKEGAQQENKWIEQAYYDVKDHLVIGSYGYAKGCFEKLPDGRIAQVNYGANGKLVFNPLQGFAIHKTDNRTQGDTVDSYHGANGELINGPEGYAEARRHFDKDGKLLNLAYFGADGKPVAGPKGFHRFERAKNDSESNEFFDTEGSKLSESDFKSLVPVIVITEIATIKLPAYQIGLQVGDILWRYGNWSFPEILSVEKSKESQEEASINIVGKAFLAERDRLSGSSTQMTVIRYGKPVQLTVPALKGKQMGIRLQDRVVPNATFETWKNMSIKK